MKLVRLLLISTFLFVMGSSAASALPVTFQLDNVTIVDGTLPTSQTYDPTLPLIGSGSINFTFGFGVVTLPDYSLFIDANLDGDDVRLDITNWSQTIHSIDGTGNIVSTGGGETACADLGGGGFGAFICPTIGVGVAGWPAGDGPVLLSSAVIDKIAQTITVIDNSSVAAGTVTQFYSYTIVPEPSTALLLGAGLCGIALRRRA